MVAAIFDEINKSIQNSSLVLDFRMDHLPSLFQKFDRLAELLVKFSFGTVFHVHCRSRNLDLTFSGAMLDSALTIF